MSQNGSIPIRISASSGNALSCWSSVTSTLLCSCCKICSSLHCLWFSTVTIVPYGIIIIFSFLCFENYKFPIIRRVPDSFDFRKIARSLFFFLTLSVIAIISLQWGFGKIAQTFTLPISTQWSKVVAFHNGNIPDTVCVTTDVVQSTFTVKSMSSAVDAHYISIGK